MTRRDGLRMFAALALVGSVIFVARAAPVSACKPARSQVEKRAFVRTHPCPATRKSTTSCRGYVIDHVLPLCAGGPDKASNMQWQTLKAAAAKDRLEVAFCACLRAKRPNCSFTP